MNYTENYQLNQWEQTDRVLMEDFNADNAKLDAALKTNAEAVIALANRSRFTKLKEITIQDYTTTVEIDLSDVEWNQWSKVHLDCLTNNNDGANLYYNTTENANYRFSVNGMWGLIHRPRLTFRVGFDAERLIDAVWATQSHLDTKTYSQLNKLLITGDTMDPGAVFTLWGEK